MATVTRKWNQLPHQQSYSIKQGDGLSDPWQMKIKAEAATAYTDLTLVGTTIKLYVKKGGTTVIAGTPVVADDVAEGKFTLAISGATTETWIGNYQYELQVTFPTGHTNFPAGTVKTILEGSITVRADI
jgi:hypothetical protein